MREGYDWDDVSEAGRMCGGGSIDGSTRGRKGVNGEGAVLGERGAGESGGMRVRRVFGGRATAGGLSTLGVTRNIIPLRSVSLSASVGSQQRRRGDEVQRLVVDGVDLHVRRGRKEQSDTSIRHQHTSTQAAE